MVGLDASREWADREVREREAERNRWCGGVVVGRVRVRETRRGCDCGAAAGASHVGCGGLRRTYNTVDECFG